MARPLREDGQPSMTGRMWDGGFWKLFLTGNTKALPSRAGFRISFTNIIGFLGDTRKPGVLSGIHLIQLRLDEFSAWSQLD